MKIQLQTKVIHGIQCHLDSICFHLITESDNYFIMQLKFVFKFELQNYPAEKELFMMRL